jgi:hypothetical protein
MRAGELGEYIEHFRGRVLQEALAAALEIHWTRRAEEWERVSPKPGDFVGRASRAEIEERRQRCAAIARACRHRAAVSVLGGEVA